MNGILAELRRRKVFRVAGAYAVIGWLLAQISVTLETSLNLPGWFDTLIVSLLLIGFPVALLLAWAFEVTPEGIKLSDPVASNGEKPRRRGRMIDLAALAGLAIIAILIVGNALRPTKGESTGFAQRRTDAGEALAIAVMPFINMSNDPDNAYFADGMSEEILNALSRRKGLNVVSRTSSFALRGTDATATEIGERLRADLILEGSVRKAGPKVRISATLIDTTAGNQLWTETYDRTLDDLFGVQDEVSAQIADALPGLVGIAPLEAPPVRANASVDPEAYRLYLEARFLEGKRGIAIEQRHFDEALALTRQIDNLAQQARALDPNFAGPLVIIANMMRTTAGQELYGFNDYGEAVAASSDLYDKALALDPDAADVLIAQAELRSRYQWQWEDATELFERALAAAPNSADAHTDYAYHLSKIGRCVEALELGRAGARLEPSSGWRSLAEPRILPCLGRSDEAAAIYESTIKSNGPQLFIVRDVFYYYFFARDVPGLQRLDAQFRQADWGDDARNLEERSYWLEMIAGSIAAFNGDPERLIAFVDAGVAAHDADVAAGRNVDLRDDRLWAWSVLYAWTGEYDKALDMYERAIKAEVLYFPQNFPYAIHEFPEPMRSDPRYMAIWENEPSLAALKRLRLEALKNRQFQGILPDGTVVEPKAD